MDTLTKGLMFKKVTLSYLEGHENETVYQKLIRTQGLLQLVRIENEQIVGDFACRLVKRLRSIIYRYQIIYRLTHSVASRFLRRRPKLENQKVRYKKWIEDHDRLSSIDCKAIEDHMQSLAWKPIFTIILFVEGQERNDLDRSLASVYHQLYGNWELTVLFNSSKNPKALQAIKEAIQPYKESYLQSVQVADTTDLNHNKFTLDKAQGEYVIFFHSGDLLSPHALYMLTFAVNWNDKADVLYSDEDFIDQNDDRFSPYFKPDWNLDLFLSRNYIHNLCALRRKVISKKEKNSNLLRGRKLYNLLLEVIVTTRRENIVHLPFVLYHNRTNSKSLEDSEAHNSSFSIDPIAIREYFKNRNIDGLIEKVG